MRVFLSFVLALTMGLPMTACGSDGNTLSQYPSDGAGAVTEAPAEPVPPTGDTAATAAADSRHQQTLYLWEEGNVPAVTEYTDNPGGAVRPAECGGVRH